MKNIARAMEATLYLKFMALMHPKSAISAD
jgi:hypothetical protein